MPGDLGLGTKPLCSEHRQAAKNVTPLVLGLHLRFLPWAMWKGINGKRPSPQPPPTANIIFSTSFKPLFIFAYFLEYGNEEFSYNIPGA
jgi:hypothetical protein